MGNMQDLKDAIAAEHAEVQAMLSDLKQQLIDLQAKFDAGTVTSADFDVVIAAVKAISDPDVPAAL